MIGRFVARVETFERGFQSVYLDVHIFPAVLVTLPPRVYIVDAATPQEGLACWGCMIPRSVLLDVAVLKRLL